MTGSTADRGTTSIISTAEGLGMPATLTDLNGGSAKSEARLKCPEKALLSPNTTLLMTGNSGLTSIMTGNTGVLSMVAEDLGMAFIAARDSGVANQTGGVATLADEVAGEEAALSGGGSGCGLAAILGADSGCDMAAILGADLDMVAILNVDSVCDISDILSADSDWSMAGILGIGSLALQRTFRPFFYFCYIQFKVRPLTFLRP